MQQFKRIGLCLLASMVVSLSFAGSYSCQSQGVMIPCDARGWHVLAEALYVQPTNDDLAYEEISTDVRTRYDIKPTYRFAWRFEAGYHYGKGNDVTVNWTHLKRTYHTGFSFNQVDDQFIYSANTYFDTEILNLEHGQVFNIGDNGDLRLHWGLQFLDIDHHLMALSQEYENGDGGRLLVGENGYKLPSNFKGIGPRLGADWIYPLSRGFQLVTRTALSLVVGNLDGQIKQKQESISMWTTLLEENGTRTVIAGLEGRWALQWSKALDKGILTLQGGWHFAGYYQTIHHNIYFNQQNISNFGLHGLFFNVMFSG